MCLLTLVQYSVESSHFGLLHVLLQFGILPLPIHSHFPFLHLAFSLEFLCNPFEIYSIKGLTDNQDKDNNQAIGPQGQNRCKCYYLYHIEYFCHWFLFHIPCRPSYLEYMGKQQWCFHLTLEVIVLEWGVLQVVEYVQKHSHHLLNRIRVCIDKQSHFRPELNLN